jgi:hypothetical protein
MKNDNTDIFYVKGVSATTGSIVHRAVGYSPPSKAFWLAGNYNNFNVNPSFTQAWASLHQFGTNRQPSTVYQIGYYQHDVKAILDTAIATAGTAFQLTSYTRVFSIGPVTNTTSDVFYVKGPLTSNGGISHYSIFYDHTNLVWNVGGRHVGGFNVDPYAVHPNFTNSYLFGTNGQPSNIVEHVV